MRVWNQKIYTAPGVITTTDVSDVFQTEHTVGFKVQINYTATGLVVVEDPLLEFTVSVEGSTDYGLVRDKSTAQWASIGRQIVATAGSPININVSDAYGPFYRVKTTVTIGQIDTLEAYVYAKGV